MKRIFNSFLTAFIIPVTLYKKIGKNNFLLGLIIGAFFSLFINIITVGVQEEIQRQRILEAVENEVTYNIFSANNIISKNNNEKAKNTDINIYYTNIKYSRDLWEQSSEPLQYIVQLDQNTQGRIFAYYTGIIPSVNALQNKIENLREGRFSDCFSLNYDTKIVIDGLTCKQWNDFLRDFETQNAELIVKYGYEVINDFHPTFDRLHNPFLRLIIGDKAINFLSTR